MNKIEIAMVLLIVFIWVFIDAGILVLFLSGGNFISAMVIAGLAAAMITSTTCKAIKDNF